MNQVSEIDLLLIDASWHTSAPGTIAGMLAIQDVTNPEHHSGIDQRATELEFELRDRFAGQDRAAIQATPPFPAYAAYYKRFGQRYHVGMQVESVALKRKSLPRVAALVEAMFIAELRHGILTAGHDLDAVTLPVRLASGTGTETFTKPNGEETAVKPGDIYTATAEGVLSAVIAGPSSIARITPATTSALFVVYAPPGVSSDQVDAHLDDLEANVRVIAPQAETIARAMAITGEAM